MGIPGLQSYIERNCQSYRMIEIADLVADYKKKNEKSPVLVVDLASCIFHVYSKTHADFLCGGQLKEFCKLFLLMLKNFQELGVELKLFSDGCPPDSRIELWIERRENECRQINVIHHLVKMGDLRTAIAKDQSRPVGCWAQLAASLKANGFEVTITALDADAEILQYVNQHGCFAVLAQDSDFIIAEGVDTYISMKDLDIYRMRGGVYRKHELASDLNLDVKYFPVLATLLGNDVVKNETVRQFHLQLLPKDDKKIRRDSEFLPRFKIIPLIVNFINNTLNLDMSVSKMANTLATATDNLEMEADYERSMNSYKPLDVTDTNISDEGENATLKKYCLEEVNGNVLFHILSKRKMFSGVGPEYYDNSRYPPKSPIRNIGRTATQLSH